MSTKTIIVLSSNPTNLSSALAGCQQFATVEAEYGAVEVEGSSDLLTLNHHVRPSRPCPCSLDNEAFDAVREGIEAIGVSHFDLDTLGGCAALLGRKTEAPAFWACAAFVDTAGPHRIRECESYSKEVHVLLASFWAWSQANRLMAPRDGSCQDVTEFFSTAIAELGAILAGERDDRGKSFLNDEENIKVNSFVRDGVTSSGLRVALRSAESFVNHLYYMEDGSPADVVVGHNSQFKSVVVSRADDSVALVARDFVQEMWGDLAGGHPGVAGSPRGQEMTMENAERAFEALLAK